MTVSAGGSGDLVGLSVDGTSVGLRLPVDLPAPVVEGDTATYREVYPGVDVVARATPESISTFVVVKSRSAAANPAVRKLSFGLSKSGVSGSEAINAAETAFTGANGARRVHVSAGAMWDSTGNLAATSAKGRVAPAASAEQRKMTMKVTGSRLDVSPDVSLLDDPGTVFPVVIDPSIKPYETNYFKRLVSNNCFSATSNTHDGLYTGDKARVGYNGWSTSDCGSYYESRVFYRFNMVAFQGIYVRHAYFYHTNSYSPQHSPCDNASYGYPIIAGVTGAYADNATQWSQRPDFYANPAKNNYGAGASPTYCSAKKDVMWDLTSQFHQIFDGRSFAGQLTIGMKGDNLTEKMNWREYNNTWATGGSSRPFLKFEYAVPPAAPASVDFAPDASNPLLFASDAYPDMYTSGVRPTFRTTVPAGAVDQCPTSAPCYLARFEVLDESGVRVGGSFDSGLTAAGQLASAQVPTTLQSGKAYQVRAYLVNTAYGMTSTATSMAKRLRVAATEPIKPTWSPGIQADLPHNSVWSAEAWLDLPAGQSTDQIEMWCLADQSIEDAAIVRSDPLTSCKTSSATRETLSTKPLSGPEPDPRGGGTTQYSFRVWVWYVTGLSASSTSVADLAVQAPTP